MHDRCGVVLSSTVYVLVGKPESRLKNSRRRRWSASSSSSLRCSIYDLYFKFIMTSNYTLGRLVYADCTHCKSSLLFSRKQSVVRITPPPLRHHSPGLPPRSTRELCRMCLGLFPYMCTVYVHVYACVIALVACFVAALTLLAYCVFAACCEPRF